MKCPLLLRPDYTDDKGTTHKWGDCLQDSCAWWDNNTGYCSILALSRVLVAIGNMLGIIKK